MLRALLPGLLLARTAVASKPNLVYVLSDNLCVTLPRGCGQQTVTSTYA
jgi:hypothetical protein